VKRNARSWRISIEEHKRSSHSSKSAYKDTKKLKNFFKEN
jgi:hypothetical protein